MTVLEVIERSAQFLSRKGVESPRLQVEWILSQVMNLPRLNLYLEFSRQLSVGEMNRVREMVQRRGGREPLQYVLGSACFCGLELETGPGVLVPRPETEQVAERAWGVLQEQVRSQAGRVSAVEILDFGTGTGSLAIAVSRMVPEARALAVDRSVEALGYARRNVRQHGVEERVQLVRGADLDWVRAGSLWLLISNPPYIPSGTIEGLEPEVRCFEPREALDGGADGLEWYRYLAVEGKRAIRPGGGCVFEIGEDQGPALRELMQAAGWMNVQVETDFSGRDRILIAEAGES